MAMDLSKAKVGDNLPEITFGPYTRKLLALYGGASGDHNAVHIDTDFARCTRVRRILVTSSCEDY